VVGLPLSWPVEVFNVIPRGRDPETIENVYGPFPPVTAMLAE
jgi:hypothetical protein